MKITTNVIGNYAPQIVRNPVKNVNENKTVNQVQANPSNSIKKDNLTLDEKNFFMKLYPENKSEIMDYHFYQKSGKMSGVKVGSLFDMKG